MRERVREERESRCDVQRVDRQSMIEQGKKEKKKHGAWSILNERGWVRETRLVESRTERRPRVRRRENRARTLVDALRWVEGEGHSIEGERAGEGKAASRKIVQHGRPITNDTKGDRIPVWGRSETRVRVRVRARARAEERWTRLRVDER